MVKLKAEADASAFLLPRRVEHIFDKDAVALGGVVYQHVGDGADQLTVLEDRRARHALHDTAGALLQRLIGDGDDKVFVIGTVAVDLRDLDLIMLWAIVAEGADDLGLALLHVVA